VHLALRFKYGGWWPFGNFDDVIQHFARDPSGIYVAARRVAALLGVAGAVAVYSVGRRLWDRRTGLVAAAVLAFAFLPVTYSRIALTDVGVLVPVALVLLFAVRIQETGSLRWCAAAGAAAGVAIGFKYTAGLVLLAPLAALVLRREWRGARSAGSSCWPSRSWPSSSRRRTSSSTSRTPGASWARRPTARTASRSSANRAPTASPTTWAASPGAWAGSRCWPPWRAA
jgi:hypothetical protein